MNSMTRTGRVLWFLFLAFCVVCSVWSVWQLFTDADRVVSAVVVGIVTLAFARPAVSNLVVGRLVAVLETSEMRGFSLRVAPVSAGHGGRRYFYAASGEQRPRAG